MGFFSSISKKIADMRQRSKDKKEFFDTILRAAGDGVLTDEEVAQIQTRYKELGLTQDDLKGIRVQAYNAALRAVKSDGVVTAEEEAELGKLQRFLMIPESEIAKSKRELARLRLLTEIQNGKPLTRQSRGTAQKRAAPHFYVSPQTPPMLTHYTKNNHSLLDNSEVGRNWLF
jgi:hypothetical protein